jgi:hypothetical protein
MTSAVVPERRRVPRLRVEAERTVSFGVSCQAQVLEINLSGVLLGSKTELEAGERGELQATVGSRPLRVGIEIRAVSQQIRARNGPRWQLGAAFVRMPAEQRVLLLDLLGVERS